MTEEMKKLREEYSIHRTKKIKYYVTTLDAKTKEIVYRAAMIVAIIAFSLVIVCLKMPDMLGYWLYDHLFYIVFAAIVYGVIFIPGVIKRARIRYQAKDIIQNGQLVVGEITDINTIDVGTGRSFTYHIEYENPEGETVKKIMTPPTLIDMNIDLEDLPLKVLVYCYNNQYFADRIINPPTVKMFFRRMKKWVPFILITVIVMILIVLFMTLLLTEGMLSTRA